MSTPVDTITIKLPKPEMNQDNHNNDNNTPTLVQPNFKYTTFPLKGYTILPTRNITSNFVHWMLLKSKETKPVMKPYVQTKKKNGTIQLLFTLDPKINRLDRNAERTQLEDENAKRRTLPNADNQVISFNSQAPKETIPDHNDPYRVEWINLKDPATVQDSYVGEKALKVPLDDNADYQLFYPWKNGTLNQWDYTSLYAVLGDLQTIWTSALRSELEIEDHTFENFNAVIVVPDSLDRSLVCHLITMMLEHMKFRGVIAQQASTCATFGAGVSSACVVDIGAQTTTIACIDEGVQLLDARMSIDLGGDDITRTFTSFLQVNQFPYHDLNLAKSYDWRLAEDLKEKWCTMNEAEISVQVYDFFVRAPHQHTYKYQCKVYDEVFLAPLCLVYPNILKNKNLDDEVVDGFVPSGVVDDIAEEQPSNGSTNISIQSVAATSSAAKSKQALQSPRPTVNEGTSPAPTPNSDVAAATPSSSSTNTTTKKRNTNKHYPIDIAIAQAIQSASGNSDDRLKRFFTNIIVVGGGGKISNFDRVLEDRLLSTVVARTCRVDDVEVLPAPREMDPQILVWKGASVMCKLDMSKDMWIGEPEWTEAGSRLLRDRSLLLF
ncbi:unnamed protein product [Absidia cylindrospora]